MVQELDCIPDKNKSHDFTNHGFIFARLSRTRLDPAKFQLMFFCKAIADRM